MTVSLRKHCQPWKAERAREFRTNPTKSEGILWQRLRCRRLGVRFRRQSVIRGWIADFYCPEAKLIVELDGPQHDPVEDARRDAAILKLGIRTLRINSADVFQALPVVILEIKKAIGNG